jgi:DNA excision repair protein ERCC-5
MAEFKHKHRGVRRNWEPPPGFPSDAVAQAYAEPRVDTSKDKFSFGCPDVELLRRFCAERFGWSAGQAEELLGPVAAAYEQRQSQATLDSFLTMRQRFAKIKSKRLQRVGLPRGWGVSERGARRAPRLAWRTGTQPAG